MALIRREPFSELERMRRQMDRMFGSMLGGGLMKLPGLEEAQVFLPNVEVFETDKEVVVNAELPGLDPKDVDVEISEDSVTIRGETSTSSEVKEDTYFHSERQYGKFERTIGLPDLIKDKEAKATFKHGLLTVRAPLAVEKKRPESRKIQIVSE